MYKFASANHVGLDLIIIVVKLLDIPCKAPAFGRLSYLKHLEWYLNEPLIEVYISKDVDTSCNVANIINYYLN